MPYAAWCVWVRVRIGEFPFLANTPSRRGAVGLPFAGIHYSIVHRPFDAGAIFVLLAITVVLGGAGAWVARGNPIGLLAALFTALTLCLGPEGLRFIGEVVRVFFEPEIFGLLALVIGLRGRGPKRSAHRSPLTRARGDRA